MKRLIAISTLAIFATFAAHATTKEECLDWGKAQGTMTATSYCSMKLNDGPLQDQIQPAPADCRPYTEDMLNNCRSQMLVEAKKYVSESRRSCEPFTKDKFMNSFSLEMGVGCRAGAMFMEPRDEDEVKGCIVTKVVRNGRGSNIDVANYCGRDIKIRNLDVFWGKNIKTESMGMRSVNMVIKPFYTETNETPIYHTLFRVAAKSLIGSWDFKYKIDMVLMTEDGQSETNITNSCDHWLDVPLIVEKVCQ